MPYSHHVAERTLNLFKRRPFTLFFRVLVLTFAAQRQEFLYIIIFIIGISIWLLESIALYVDPKLANHYLLRLANFLFLIVALAAAILHFIPTIQYTAESVAPYIQER